MFPPELVTLDSPCDAFETTPEALSLAADTVSLALSFALPAVSAVVEACLTFCRRRRNLDCRSSARVAGGADMTAEAQRCSPSQLSVVGRVIEPRLSVCGSIGSRRWSFEALRERSTLGTLRKKL